jgi:hypothetical protein
VPSSRPTVARRFAVTSPVVPKDGERLHVERGGILGSVRDLGHGQRGGVGVEQEERAIALAAEIVCRRSGQPERGGDDGNKIRFVEVGVRRRQDGGEVGQTLIARGRCWGASSAGGGGVHRPLMVAVSMVAGRWRR